MLKIIFEFTGALVEFEKLTRPVVVDYIVPEKRATDQNTVARIFHIDATNLYEIIKLQSWNSHFRGVDGGVDHPSVSHLNRLSVRRREAEPQRHAAVYAYYRSASVDNAAEAFGRRIRVSPKK